MSQSNHQQTRERFPEIERLFGKEEALRVWKEALSGIAPVCTGDVESIIAVEILDTLIAGLPDGPAAEIRLRGWPTWPTSPADYDIFDSLVRMDRRLVFCLKTINDRRTAILAAAAH